MLKTSKYLKTCPTRFPGAQSASLHPELPQGLLKVNSYSSVGFSLHRGRWQMPLMFCGCGFPSGGCRIVVLLVSSVCPLVVEADGRDCLWGKRSCSCGQGSDHIRSVAQSCPTLWDPMNHSTPGLPVYHQLPEFTQTHVHRGSDAIQPSHPLSSPSPLAPNPSQHQSLFQ